MTKEEKYYRRSYTLLHSLFEAYESGFNKKRTFEFWQQKFLEFVDNPLVSAQQINSLMLTIVISLLGLNKESIEKQEKVKDYTSSIIQKDFRTHDLMPDSKQKIIEFESLRSKNTIFDNWLSIINSPSTDITNSDIFRRVRNGILHANFTVDLDAFQTSFTHIKTKSYYESLIFNPNFYQFIFSYYSNVYGMGLSEEDRLFDVVPMDINNIENLREYLNNLSIIKFWSTIKNYDGTNSLGIKFQESLSKDKRFISTAKMRRLLNGASDSGINIKSFDTYYLAEKTVDSIIKRILSNYANFFELDQKSKESIIQSSVGFTVDSKSEISNWLAHFYHLINSISNKDFNINDDMFLGDEFANESCKSALVILQAYLVLYRLQNIKDKNAINSDKFEKIDYSMIDFDFNANDFYMWSENVDGSENRDYYQESYDKQVSKYPNMNQEEIKLSIICDVIRNGLAHGNINCFASDETGEIVIEFKDISPKNQNETRCLQMTVDKLKKFLDSEAFLPRNCYKKMSERSNLR